MAKHSFLLNQLETFIGIYRLLGSHVSIFAIVTHAVFLCVCGGAVTSRYGELGTLGNEFAHMCLTL